MMDLLQAVHERHSVRAYENRPLSVEAVQALEEYIEELNAVSDLTPESPDWYRQGVEAALLAPTAVNQQKFRFALRGGKVEAKTLPFAPCGKIDLGIVKYHFELGSGKDHEVWAK